MWSIRQSYRPPCDTADKAGNESRVDRTFGKEEESLYLTSMQVLKAVAEDFQYEQAEITVTCAGHEFYAKGKRTEQMGYKEVEAAFQKKYQQGQKKRMKRKKEYSRNI